MSGRHVPNGEEYVLVPVSKLRMSVRRKIIIGITALSSVLAVGIGTGTFASFSATTTNSGNVFSTGKLQLSNTVSTGSACFSGYTGIGLTSPQTNLDNNDNASCAALFPSVALRPGAASDPANLTIQNTGSYNGLLQFTVPGCTDDVGSGVAGGSTLCNKLRVYIQETQQDFTTNASATCVFPAKSGAPCSTTWADGTQTLSDLALYASSYVPSTAMTLNQGAKRYFKVVVQFPDGGFTDGVGTDNAYQNRTAAFSLTWRLQETA
jgi:predicted ribosomally synthesized peptide with SipW-like signal peptide